MSHSFIQQRQKLSLVDRCLPDLPIPNPGLSGIWELDLKIRAEFSGPIQMWEQGLVSSVELWEALSDILVRERN